VVTDNKFHKLTVTGKKLGQKTVSMQHQTTSTIVNLTIKAN